MRTILWIAAQPPIRRCPPVAEHHKSNYRLKVGFAQSDGYEIFYETHGEGPAMVLLHSFLCDGEMWAEQVGPLSQRHRIINIDLRGHGHSSPADRPLDLYELVDDVIAVLDHENVDHAMWAGLSIGGMVALRAAINYSQRVTGLILLDSHAGTETRWKSLKYKAMVALVKRLGFAPLLPTVARLMFGRHTRETNPSLVRHWKKKFAAMPIESIDNMVDALCARDSLRNKLGNIHQPTLVMAGEEDVSLPPQCSVSMAAKLPHATLHLIPRAGHLSVLEQPGAVTTVMLDWLARWTH